MVVGAAAHDPEAAVLHGLAHRLTVLHDLRGVRLHLRLHPFTEADGLGRNDVLERTALHAREDGGVERLGVLRLAQNETAARSAKRLVRGRGDEIRVRNGRFMRAARDKAGDMRHIDHHDASRLVADLADALEVDGARIRARARKEDLRLHLQRLFLQRVVVETLCRAVHRVRDNVIELAREVDRRTVREVSALIERQRKDRVAGFDRGEIHRHVRRAAAVGLHVRMLRAKERACALARQLLRRIHRQTARIPALARIALGVLVHQHAAGGETHGARRGVFGRDQVDLGILLHHLRLDGRPHLGILAGEKREVGKTLRALKLRTADDMARRLVHGRGEEGRKHVARRLLVGRVRADAKDVRAIVAAGGLGLLDGMAQRRAHILETVRGHGHAETRTADEHAEINIPLRDGERHVIRVIRVVAGLRIEASLVFAALERGHKSGLEFKSAVIGTDGNLHVCGTFLKFGCEFYQNLPSGSSHRSVRMSVKPPRAAMR